MSWRCADTDPPPTKGEPFVYACVRPGEKKIGVGIAYWTVSQKWNPEQESTSNPRGFTHWMPLPDPPA